MRKYTTVVSLIFLVPFLLFLIVLNGSYKTPYKVSESDEIKSIYISSRNGGNEIAEIISSPCKCDCDNSSINNYESTTAQVMTDENGADYDIDTNQQNTGSKSENSQETNTIVFVITPTYTRPTQMADMTRLAQTLMLVNDVFWIVVEDANKTNIQVEALLNRTKIPYAQLLGPRPKTHLDKRSGRGVSNRRKALEWLRQKYSKTKQKGVIYFADDDNSYDIRVFEEIRSTKKVSVFPVGLLAKIGLSSPIISNETGKIIGFHDPFLTRRKFAVDMAGFAVNLQILLKKPKATMPYKVGYEEDYFLKSLGIKLNDLEPKANNCTEVLVWHTKTQSAVNPVYPNLAKVKNHNETNLPLLYESVLKTT